MDTDVFSFALAVNVLAVIICSRVAQAAVQAQLSGVPHESEALLRGVLQYMLEGQHGSTQDLLFVVTVLVGAMLDQRKVSQE
jgi:hypothetical protein